MKQLIILIGLKGSGKTYIGSLIQERLGIHFVRVEEVWLSIQHKRFSKDYYSEGFKLVEQEIANQFLNLDIITIESTGISNYFKPFLRELGYKYNLKLIKINTSPDTCLNRFKSRDSSIHIPVSDDLFEQINKEALEVDLEYDAFLENEYSSDDEILQKISETIETN
jgi:shikimate kinase